jgi:hypothetical protein
LYFRQEEEFITFEEAQQQKTPQAPEILDVNRIGLAKQ